MTVAPGYTLDASVIFNAFNPHEAGHAISLQLQTTFQTQAISVIVPTLLLTEVAATISRIVGDAPLARSFTQRLSQLPSTRFISLTRKEALATVAVAADHRLRGSDAVYAAVALRYNTVLITLDNEQRNRTIGFIPVRTPAEALAELGL